MTDIRTKGQSVYDRDYREEFMRDHALGEHQLLNPNYDDMQVDTPLAQDMVKPNGWLWKTLREDEQNHVLERYKEAKYKDEFGYMREIRKQIPDDVFEIHFGETQLAQPGGMAKDLMDVEEQSYGDY